MDNTKQRTADHAPHSHDMFQMLCEGADLVSSVWQPLLKSVGRWNLEVAGLGVKQTQATLQLSRDLSRCRTPGDIASANIRYWDAMTSQFALSSQRLAATAVRSVEQTSADATEVVALRVRAPNRDLIVIPEQPELVVSPAPDLKVA